ncbi:hypothetical protein HSR121_0531 [Halapricum desulfuricans]|uniref:Uncharacterized protein n=1 Tax=Halapricum desulfuricans TaxID=2841257 RepID=A0A897N3K3_9EURY|nr:hypothetical protein HSR121_0531 [Halapricum desulfuricans]
MPGHAVGLVASGRVLRLAIGVVRHVRPSWLQALLALDGPVYSSEE